MSSDPLNLTSITKTGALKLNASLAPLSWFRSGGKVDYVFTPETEEELTAFLKRLPLHTPLFVLGLGSNVLVRDGGVEGVVIQLGKGFAKASKEGDKHLRVGAALPDVKVARLAATHGLGGFAFLRGIPGTVGGLLRMNGGAYGRDAQAVVKQVRAIDRSGKVHLLSGEDMGFSYRHSAAHEDFIFTEALLEGYDKDPHVITQEMQEVAERRNTTQPVNTRTGGSTFKNPSEARAWELIDSAGCRGLRCGQAHVSHQHCNFLINSGHATSSEIEALGEEVRRRVADHSGVLLEWEIKRIGRFLTPSPSFVFDYA
jgi:UDP-N-acetylmuramate dehydrogenase